MAVTEATSETKCSVSFLSLLLFKDVRFVWDADMLVLASLLHFVWGATSEPRFELIQLPSGDEQVSVHLRLLYSKPSISKGGMIDWSDILLFVQRFAVVLSEQRRDEPSVNSPAVVAVSEGSVALWLFWRSDSASCCYFSISLSLPLSFCSLFMSWKESIYIYTHTHTISRLITTTYNNLS